MQDTRTAPEGPLEAYCTTGTSPGRPTLHLLGVGGVGRALLRSLGEGRVRLVAVSDSNGTVANPAGLNPSRVAELKERTGRVSASVKPLVPGDLEAIGADIVVDATSTTPGRSSWGERLDHEVVRQGRHLVLVAKDALRERAAAWDRAPHRHLVRYNAVLGGAGHALHTELRTLRTAARAVAIAGNATTTTVIDAVERGASLADGIEIARRRGLLESDPELDFRGVDAATKLAIVVGALRRAPVALDAIGCDDLRGLDVERVRARARDGRTTRLVARAGRHGPLQVRYEEVTRGHWLDVPSDRVVYGYEVAGGGVRVHVGEGLGAERTAEAALADVDRAVAALAVRADVPGGAR